MEALDSFYFSLVQKKALVLLKEKFSRVLRNSFCTHLAVGGYKRVYFSKSQLHMKGHFFSIPAGMWYSLSSICILVSSLL